MSLRIGDEVRYAINPMPDVTDEAVIKRAKLRRRASRVHPFVMSWKVGSGHSDTIHIHLHPTDEPLALRGKNEWRIFEDQWTEWGGIIVPENISADDLLDRKIRGLERARETWNAVGIERADAYQILQGLSDEQMERQKATIWKWYYNQALVEIIDEEIDRLSGVVPEELETEEE